MMQLPYQERKKERTTPKRPSATWNPNTKNGWKMNEKQKRIKNRHDSCFSKMAFFGSFFMLFLACFWFHFSEKQNEKWDEKRIKNGNRERHYWNLERFVEWLCRTLVKTVNLTDHVSQIFTLPRPPLRGSSWMKSFGMSYNRLKCECFTPAT